MKTKYTYIEFEQVEILGFSLWRCRNRKRTILGHMGYIEKWHEWGWQPEPDMEFTIQCNDDISDFLRQLNGTDKWCVWTYDENHDTWDTACGEAFCFTDGGPKENRIRFCGYCGKKLKEVKPK